VPILGGVERLQGEPMRRWAAGAHRARLAVREPSYWLGLVGVAGAYVASAKFGISLSVAHGVITPVWAPSGLSLAALLLLGPRFWPAVALGALIANSTSGAGAAVAAGIAVGNTLEAVAGAYLLRRVGFRLGLERVRDVLALALLGAGLSTLLAATNGVTVLSLAHVRQGSYGSDWLLWWFGDAVGDLILTPFLLVAVSYGRRWRLPGRAVMCEALVLAASLGALNAVVFLWGGWRYPYLLFPLLLWAALRFRQLGAATSSLLVGAAGTWGTVAGTVPIAATSPTERVQIIQALVGVLAISLLVLGATLSERETANQQVKQTAARLSEAQALAHIGSWTLELADDQFGWSDELYRIFGFAPGSVGVSYGFFLERVHPDDRTVVERTVRQAYSDRQPFSFEHRIILPGGGERLLHGRGRVLLDEIGQPARMVGTAQDITEQRQAERLRDDILASVSHELRTPLTSVLGFAITLHERGEHLGKEAAANAIEQIVQQAHRLERLLGDLLDLDRLRHGQIAPVRQATAVTQLVSQIAVAHQTDGYAITVSAAPITANLDTAMVERLVDNLLANAVRHTPPGTSITLRLERQAEDLLLIVEDDGPGIPDELKATVFEIFNRGAKIMSNERGTGIGLALVARFAALHGGRAWVEDSPGGGASFHIWLPRCLPPQAPESAKRGTTPISAASAPPDRPAPSTAPARLKPAQYSRAPPPSGEPAH
jgi:signal transduction histidine kinase